MIEYWYSDAARGFILACTTTGEPLGVLSDEAEASRYATHNPAMDDRRDNLS